MNRISWLRLFVFSALALGLACAAACADPDTVWIEGEFPSAITPATIKPSIEDVGMPQYLSGGKWLHVNLSAEDVGKKAPDGVEIRYAFTTPKAAGYQIWDRAGYQASRNAFRWRIDGGDWHNVPVGAPFTQVQQLQTWNDVSWMRLGDQPLSAGAHTFTFQIPKAVGMDGKTQDMQFACDALCFSAVPYHPHDQYKPDDMSWQTDADRAAAQKVYAAVAPAGPAQTVTPLTGDWQMARYEEESIRDPEGPTGALPPLTELNALAWKATPAPGNVFAAHPEWLYAHRYLLRTRIEAPQSLAGRSFVLHFPALNMLATLFVNGQRCGFDNTPLAAWDCDITSTVKPGQVNDVVIVLKDWYYALPDLGAKEGEHIKYIPTDWVTRFGPAAFTFPVWNHEDSGILRPPTLIVGGPVYTSDVFCKPSVRNKSVTLEITLVNPTGEERTVSVSNAVTPLAGGPAAKTFAPQTVVVPAGASKTIEIREIWADPQLWWPDAPHQYLVTTTLTADGRAIDARATKFGFREWTWDGDNFALNGIPWHGRADLTGQNGKLDDAWLAAYHARGQTMVRLWGEGPTVDADLDWYDAHGVNVRRTDIFDGEAARYNLSAPGLWEHYQAQLAAWIKAQRNHPSIFIWSVENEITFINGHVTGQDQLTTDQHHKTAQTVTAADPTRPFMVDGGNALLDESFPVYGGHYMEPPFQSLPEGAYNDRAAFAHRQVWPVTKHKPILLGEAYFWAGNEPGDFATVGGESAFIGKAEAAPAIGLTGKMLSEGYRWDDINFHFWGGDTSDVYYNAWQPVAVLCREWDSAFSAGQFVPRTLKIFNDTHDPAPITLQWTLKFGGKTVDTGLKSYRVAPGMSQTDTATLKMPATATRQDGTWSLTLLRGGKAVFRDSKPISVLPGVRDKPTGAVAVYDPSGAVQAFLKEEGLSFTSIRSPGQAPSGAKAMIVGADALTPAQAGSSALAAYAAAGHAVIVLEQKNPLKYQALPGAMEASDDTGSIAFMEDAANPIFKGLEQRDFLTWGADGTVYRAAYRKPTANGRSLMQCDYRLQDTALAEMTPGKGLMLLSQLTIGHRLASSPVAQRLLLNMVEAGMAYKLTYRPVAVMASNPILTKTLDAVGLHYGKTSGALEAISRAGGIAVIDATTDNLAELAANPAKVNAFTRSGGWIVFNNLTPEGLSAYNRLVGVDHLIRRYGQNPTNTSIAGVKHIEKVTFATPRNPLLAGLSASNIVLGSGQQIFGFNAGQYPDEDAYSYVVDTGDVAPFATSTWPSYGNVVNGFTQQDGFWPLIINFPMPADGKPFQIPISLPRAETLTRFSYAQDLNYKATTRVSLLFDGGAKQTYDVKPNGDVQTFEINPPRQTKNVTLEINDWVRDASGGQTLVGLDNLWLYAKHPAGWEQKVKPMLNIGALVEYPKGAGGIVLCNVKFKESEGNPENVGKKQTILATLLKNLKAPFTGGASVIAGASDLTYTPIDIKSKVNQYKNEQGWFGDKAHTFADLPGGTQRYAGVPYNIFNFTTSPVPTVIMLGGNGVPGNLPDHVDGIPVGRKADALFFLQAARIDQPINDDDRRNGRRFEMADYVVHYADGTTVKVPITVQSGVENYRQSGPPLQIADAQVAWQKPYPDGSLAVAYAMQWNNPHPEKVIASVDLTYGPDRRGVPALLALTAATAAAQ